MMLNLRRGVNGCVQRTIILWVPVSSACSCMALGIYSIHTRFFVDIITFMKTVSAQHMFVFFLTASHFYDLTFFSKHFLSRWPVASICQMAYLVLSSLRTVWEPCCFVETRWRWERSTSRMLLRFGLLSASSVYITYSSSRPILLKACTGVEAGFPAPVSLGFSLLET